MSTYSITEHNAITNEIVTRPMVDDEIAYIEEQKQIFDQSQAKLAADQIKKSAVLEKLGITEEELRAALA